MPYNIHRQVIQNMENIVAKAYDLLIKKGITSLPIDPLIFNKLDCGLKIISYNQGRDLIDELGIKDDVSRRQGLSVMVGGKYIIMYDPELSSSARKLVIAHEIGHIDLEHGSYNKIIGAAKDKKIKKQQEKEADTYAYALLAPLPVLHELNISDYKRIQQVTGLSRVDARAVIRLLNKRYGNDNRPTPIEANLIETFSEYINKYAQPVDNNILSNITYAVYMIVIAMVTVIVVVLMLRDLQPVSPMSSSSGVTSISSNVSDVGTSSQVSNSISSTPHSNDSQDNNVYYNEPDVIYYYNNYTYVTPSSQAPASSSEPNVISRVYSSEWPLDVPDDPAPEPPTPTNNTQDYVYTTPGGSKYHKAGCQYISGRYDLSTFSTPAKAQEAGYKPCEKCF